MEQVEVKWPVERKRGRYSNEFKRELAAACSAPGVSVASVALANGINANLLRRWVAQLAPQAKTPTGLTSLAVSPATLASSGNLARPADSSAQAGFVRITSGQHGIAEADTRLEMRLQRGDVQLVITGTSMGCATFVHALLR